jgi:hypothetical protein
VNSRSKLRSPQGLKPGRYKALRSTAEAVPSRNIHEITPECFGQCAEIWARGSVHEGRPMPLKQKLASIPDGKKASHSGRRA